MRSLYGFIGLSLLLFVAACASHSSADLRRNDSENLGFASWYGPNFHGKKTASGETYDMYDATAAHKSLAFGTLVRVTRLDNGMSTVVRINDRGPFVKGRVVDVSYKAAQDLALLRDGLSRVKLSVLGKSPSLSVSERFFVQVGSFALEDNAARFKADLEQRFSSIPIGVFNAENLYRVWIGPLLSGDEAEAWQKRLRKEGFNTLTLSRPINLP